VNYPQEKPKTTNQAKIEAEIERLAREQGVEPFNPDEPFEGDFWTDEEFAEFEKWLKESRRQSAQELIFTTPTLG
jgi:hypothetical protein